MIELAAGVTWQTLEHAGARFDVVSVDLARASLSLVGQAPGDPHEVDKLLKSPPPGLVAATNAGLYHSPEDPVGLFVQDGVERSPLDLGEGRGNFYLRPNGVFYLDDQGAHVVDSTVYRPSDRVRTATQSGPALVLDGQLNPLFDPNSKSTHVRNAVGVVEPGRVVLVLSRDPVRFYDLATLMRDDLHCANALYLDGTISGMWGPELPKSQHPVPYAGFLVVTTHEPSGSDPAGPSPEKPACCTSSPP
jgi:uncharacterized protein YigE (DUF2233 family)